MQTHDLNHVGNNSLLSESIPFYELTTVHHESDGKMSTKYAFDSQTEISRVKDKSAGFLHHGMAQ